MTLERRSLHELRAEQILQDFICWSLFDAEQDLIERIYEACNMIVDHRHVHQISEINDGAVLICYTV